MPVVLRDDGFRFFFYSNENNEPAHIHVLKAGCEAKFWLNPVSVAANAGFDAATLNKLSRMVRDNETFFLEKWNEFFTR